MNKKIVFLLIGGFLFAFLLLLVLYFFASDKGEKIEKSSQKSLDIGTVEYHYEDAQSPEAVVLLYEKELQSIIENDIDTFITDFSNPKEALIERLNTIKVPIQSQKDFMAVYLKIQNEDIGNVGDYKELLGTLLEN